jgi:hypothetical protein
MSLDLSAKTVFHSPMFSSGSVLFHSHIAPRQRDLLLTGMHQAGQEVLVLYSDQWAISTGTVMV